MYCRKLKSGKWSCTMDATPCPLTGKRRQVTRNGNTKREAMNRANKAADDLDNQRSLKDKKVIDVYKEWIDVYSNTVKPITVKARRNSLVRFLECHGEHFISALHVQDIQQYLLKERDSGLAHNTLDEIRVPICMLFDHAVRNGYAEENVARKTILPRSLKKEDKNKKKFLDADEIKLFLDSLKARRRRSAYEVAVLLLSTGLRIGEALALTWDDVDLENMTINIDKTMNEKSDNDSGFEFSDTKTTKADRVVSINGKLASMLRKMKVSYNKEILAGIRERNPVWKKLVFANVNREPYRVANIGSIFNEVLKALGIEGVTGTHFLRHTHITMLVEAETPLPVIIERVGHADIRTTMEIYTHVTKKMQDDTNKKLDEYFANFI